MCNYVQSEYVGLLGKDPLMGLAYCSVLRLWEALFFPQIVLSLQLDCYLECGWAIGFGLVGVV